MGSEGRTCVEYNRFMIQASPGLVTGADKEFSGSRSGVVLGQCALSEDSSNILLFFRGQHLNTADVRVNRVRFLASWSREQARHRQYNKVQIALAVLAK